MARCSKLAVGAVVAALAVGSLTGCRPPRAVLVVDTPGSTADASPGDGTCADAAGDCTLRTALEEADALGPAEIRLPEEPVGAQEPFFVRSDVVLRPVGDLALVAGGLVVTQGGRLDAAHLRSPADGTLSVTARGVVRLDDVHVSILQVNTDGRVVGHRVTILGPDDGAQAGFVASRGQLLLTYSTLRGSFRTGRSGALTLAASIVTGPCFSSVTSAGHNIGPASCGLTDPTDLDLTPAEAGVVADAGDARYALAPDSPARDLVPVGTAGCGEASSWPSVPAADDDGDAAPGCEAGALQLTGTAAS